ncbi:MAG: CDP-6-deoxy-delta-3,4-glucoseen reductase [Zoogloeaceae bacterium]|jgi:CDP-4-dehydro-6-deoxyglucose reductase|nr:CDP-6-deoxy-delta-3,4-glucoseen reductase [Zoogloeaceae bacterium]
MNYQITVMPSGATCTAREDETILEATLRQGILLPSGCKNGACGACKGSVLAGDIEHGHYQPHALTAEEREAGKALFCCARARSDLVIECRQASRAGEIVTKLMPARIEALEKAAPDVIVLRLMLPASETLAFRAGQYIDILLPENRRRSYSIANAPEEKGFLELHVRRVPGGFFTTQLFETMKVKDILRFEGPHGSFFLREDSVKPVILLASGTGFAPIKSIVEHTLAQKIQRSLHIYWGCRRQADLYRRALPERWAADHPHIRHTPVLSMPDAGWKGRSGYVHAAVAADYPDLSGHEVYACGNPAMVEAARRDFLALGLPEEAFYADAFTFAEPGK